ncbi:MAG: RDD family protein [Actinobacteria bacterium]|nr:RDD family protein [Actinomycetota bacterium]
MAGRRDMGSWLDGPGGSRTPVDADAEHPGARFGRPAQGAGSVASFGRRVVGLLVDWLLCVLIAQGLLSSVGRPDLMALVVLVTEHVLLVGTLGMTIGHRVAGIRVETLEGRPPGPARALVRALLLVLVVPPLFTDRDNRGLHDRAAGTLVLRAP